MFAINFKVSQIIFGVLCYSREGIPTRKKYFVNEVLQKDLNYNLPVCLVRDGLAEKEDSEFGKARIKNVDI